MQKNRNLLTQNERIGNYLTNVAYFNAGGAKEIRINNLQEWFMKKVKSYRKEMLKIQYNDFYRNTLFKIILYILIAIQSFIVLYLLSIKYISGEISIADFTLYFSAITSLTKVLSLFCEQFNNYNKQILNIKDYNKLNMLKASENNGVIDKPIYLQNINNIEIIFKNVFFAYPNSSTNILNNINIKITDKEKLVIVGKNGAGKSTFIKLLCKLYRPSNGIITLNGIDIWNIPNSQYYKNIAAVFQDYENFAFSIIDNITISDYPNKEKLNKIFSQLKINNFNNELNTYITKLFSQNGKDFSGGESQKIIIARALYKNTPLLILDEPTSSLDAKAENEIYTNFLNLSQNKTTIFISHRLAISNIADHIAVFDKGKIVEYGNHNELMKQNGLYKQMYEKQSKPYINSETI